MYCPNCGHQIPDRAVFCPACGGRVTGKGQQRRNRDKQSLMCRVSFI